MIKNLKSWWRHQHYQKEFKSSIFTIHRFKMIFWTPSILCYKLKPQNFLKRFLGKFFKSTSHLAFFENMCPKIAGFSKNIVCDKFFSLCIEYFLKLSTFGVSSDTVCDLIWISTAPSKMNWRVQRNNDDAS